MPGLSIEPFSDEHLDAAAGLLSARHARHREAEPLLPSEVDFRAAIAADAGEEGASGVIAFRGGEPVAYLVARPQPTDRLSALDYILTARIAVKGTFEDYWGARGRNLTKNMRRRRRRLEESGTKPRLEALTNPAAMARAVEEYGALESKGWRSGTGTAISGRPRMSSFCQAAPRPRARSDSSSGCSKQIRS